MAARNLSKCDEVRNHRSLGRLVLSLLTIASTLLLSGCLFVGAKAVTVDRFEYSRTIRDSWEEQVLMTVVAMTYGEPPVSLGGTARWAYHPIITYTPITLARKHLI